MAYVASRPGQDSGAGDVRALFYKKFSGEVLAAYEQKNVFANLIWTRTINSGKSAAFPLIEDADDPILFIPGNELDGSAIQQTEKVINIDGLVLAHTYVAKIDEWMNEFDIRSKYASKLGYSMAKNVDVNIAAELIKTAGSSIDVAGADFASITAEDLVAAIFEAAETLDNNNVRDDERYIAVSPKVYYKLFNFLAAIDKDYAGKGSIATGSILELAGFKIVKTNTLKNLVVPGTAGITIGKDYSAEGGTNHQVTVAGVLDTDPGLLAVAFVPEAVGMVKLRDLMTESDWISTRQAELLIAKMAAGFGGLRPEAAVVIKGVSATIS